MIEKGLKSYYTTGEKDKLRKAKKAVRSNKKNDRVMDDIKSSTHSIIDGWISDFNTDYENEEKLDRAYNRVKKYIDGVHDYFKANDLKLSFVKTDKIEYKQYKNEFQPYLSRS